MTDHLTDERLEELEYNFSSALALGVEQIPIGASTVLSLVQQLRTEREAHQATQAELEAVRSELPEINQRLTSIENTNAALVKANDLQQRELEAARKVVHSVKAYKRTPWVKTHDDLVMALDTYDAARAGQEGSDE